MKTFLILCLVTWLAAVPAATLKNNATTTLKTPLDVYRWHMAGNPDLRCFYSTSATKYFAEVSDFTTEPNIKSSYGGTAEQHRNIVNSIFSYVKRLFPTVAKDRCRYAKSTRDHLESNFRIDPKRAMSVMLALLSAGLHRDTGDYSYDTQLMAIYELNDAQHRRDRSLRKRKSDGSTLKRRKRNVLKEFQNLTKFGVERDFFGEMRIPKMSRNEIYDVIFKIQNQEEKISTIERNLRNQKRILFFLGHHFFVEKSRTNLDMAGTAEYEKAIRDLVHHSEQVDELEKELAIETDKLRHFKSSFNYGAFKDVGKRLREIDAAVASVKIATDHDRLRVNSRFSDLQDLNALKTAISRINVDEIIRLRQKDSSANFNNFPQHQFDGFVPSNRHRPPFFGKEDLVAESTGKIEKRLPPQDSDSFPDAEPRIRAPKDLKDFIHSIDADEILSLSKSPVRSLKITSAHKEEITTTTPKEEIITPTPKAEITPMEKITTTTRKPITTPKIKIAQPKTEFATTTKKVSTTTLKPITSSRPKSIVVKPESRILPPPVDAEYSTVKPDEETVEYSPGAISFPDSHEPFSEESDEISDDYDEDFPNFKRLMNQFDNSAGVKYTKETSKESPMQTTAKPPITPPSRLYNAPSFKKKKRSVSQEPETPLTYRLGRDRFTLDDDYQLHLLFE